MAVAEALLPAGFETLEPFVARWAIATTAGRAAARDKSSPVERAELYDAVVGRKAEALALLDRFPVDALPPAEQRLMDLLLAFAHISIAVEVQKDDEAKHAVDRVQMRITRSTADR